MPNNLKAGIYARVSRDDQNAQTQERICREYCQRENIEVFKVYIDNGVSGAKTSRPAFNELLSDMRVNRFNCLVILKLDRMGRSLQHLMSIVEELNSRGVHLVAVSQNLDTHSSTGRLQLQILAAFAEYERAIISERTIEGLVGKENVGKRGPDKHPRLKRGVLRARLGLDEKQG